MHESTHAATVRPCARTATGQEHHVPTARACVDGRVMHPPTVAPANRCAQLDTAAHSTAAGRRGVEIRAEAATIQQAAEALYKTRNAEGGAVPHTGQRAAAEFYSLCTRGLRPHAVVEIFLRSETCVQSSTFPPHIATHTSLKLQNAQVYNRREGLRKLLVRSFDSLTIAIGLQTTIGPSRLVASSAAPAARRRASSTSNGVWHWFSPLWLWAGCGRR